MDTRLLNLGAVMLVNGDVTITTVTLILIILRTEKLKENLESIV